MDAVTLSRIQFGFTIVVTSSITTISWLQSNG